jgi:predicted RecB family nuclease
MPRVTDVLGYIQEPELVNWMLKTPAKKREAIKEEAFRVGTLVDELVRQDCVEGGYLMPEGDASALSCMTAWEEFKKSYPAFVESVVETQTLLEDKDNEITGHPDFIIRRANDWGVVDLKTSSGIRPTYWTQTAEYSEMVRLSRGWNHPRFIAVLRLDKKEGVWEYKEIADESVIRYEVEVFKAMLMLYRHGESVREVLRKQLEAELLGG